MTGPPPVSSTASRQQSRRSSTRSTDFPVPATPRSAKRRAGTAVAPSGPLLASTSSRRTGHTTSNNTPRSYRPLPSSRASESKQSLDPRIQQELQNHVIEVETDAFVRAVLYKGAETRVKEEAKLAATCIDHLQAPPSPHEGRAGGDPADSSPQPPDKRPPTSGVPPSQEPLLSTYRYEKDMYGRHVALLNDVSKFFCGRMKDVDRAWPPAQDPTLPVASSPTRLPLNRVFRDTHNDGRLFSRYRYGQACLKPDLCLLIESQDEDEVSKDEDEVSKDENEESKDENEESKDEPEESEGKPEGSGDKPKVAAHWKDVLVAFELKPRDNIEMGTLVQMATYARSMMLEQFDRNFVITVLITGTLCRVFHWDVVQAQVTKPFGINTPLFIQVMGRLATMTPSELGYDTHFSNAGRVRSTEIDAIQTHLTIHLSPPRPFFDHSAVPSTPGCSGNGQVKMHLEKVLFESEGLLFNRATRVWRAKPVNDLPPPEGEGLCSKKQTYIVKQNWADDRRPNEGYLHSMAQALEVVPNLLGMEEREFTSSFRARFESEEVLGVLHLVETKPPRKSARRGHSILRRDASDTGDHPSTGVGDSDVSGEGSRDDMSVDDGGGDNVSGNAASEEDEGAGGYLSAVNFDVDEKGVGDNEDVADQPVASNVGASDEDANRSSPRSFERVLLRFVFDEERRPLKDAKDSIELLQATEQWIDGLIKLDDLGIIHRDISYGNLLLPSASGPTDKAGIIDFGLSHIKNPEILKQLLPENSPQDYILEDSRPHDHITGTLPFVAYELLAKFKNNKPCTHQLRHDIESVFWVLLYICLKQYEGFGGKFDDSLKALLSHNIHQVEREKRAVLGPRFLGEEEMIQGVGGSKFPDLERFLLTFVEILRDDRYRKEPGGLGPEIRELASSELSEVRKRKQQAHAASSDVPTNPKKKQKHAKAP